MTTATPVPTTINVTSPNVYSEADGVGQVNLLATVLDQFGNPMAGQTITVMAGGHETLSATTLTTNAVGQAVELVTDTTVEANSIFFTDGSAVGTANVTFRQPTPGPLSTLVATPTTEDPTIDVYDL
jgi:Bacterial Ig-like domain (group 1)